MPFFFLCFSEFSDFMIESRLIIFCKWPIEPKENGNFTTSSNRWSCSNTISGPSVVLCESLMRMKWKNQNEMAFRRDTESEMKKILI